MSPVAVISAVVAVILTIALIVLMRGRRADKHSLAQLEDQVSAAVKKVEELENHVSTLNIDVAEERSRANAAEGRATTAEGAADEARLRAENAEQRTQEIETDLRTNLADPIPLGALEALRISRLWQERVPGPGEPLPVKTDDDIHAALVVLAEACREESGTTVEIDWLVTGQIPQAKTVQIVRVAEELMAGSRSADSLTLSISSKGAEVTVSVRTEPEISLSGHLQEVLDTTGWLTVFESGEVVLTL